jgi:hypothetical protein
MLHKTSQERYEKLHVQFLRLMRHFDKEGLDDFIQTANSLREWILQDATLSQHPKDEITRFAVSNGIDWQICHQIANSQKHGGRASDRGKAKNAPSLVVKDAHVAKGGSAGFVFPQMKMRTFGSGDAIMIEYECDGKRATESALAVAFRTFQFFYYIFELAPIASLPDRLKARKTWLEILTRGWGLDSKLSPKSPKTPQFCLQQRVLSNN